MSVRLITGDCRDVLPTLAADSFDCVVTSPPYWGLRSYLPEGHADKQLEIGLEPTMAAYLETMVAVCRELRRVLKPEGTFWLNIGDSYATSGGLTPGKRTPGIGQADVADGLKRPVRDTKSLKPKDLCMIPNRLAIALQADGWYVRSEIIWHKPNPMPESVTDRPTSAHEKIWLLTKDDQYFYDAAAIAEPALYVGLTGQDPSGFKNPMNFNGKHSKNPEIRGERKTLRSATESRHRSSIQGGQSLQADPTETRNARNVWTIATQPYRGAHFATMPPELAERCIKAGCPAGGSVLDPFGGAGTTGPVADRLGRNATLIELSAAYHEMAKSRVADDAPLFTEVST